MKDIKVNRPTLGPWMDVVCFRYLSEDSEEMAGRALVVDAGRQRGQDLIEEHGLTGTHQTADAIQQELDKAFGINGTRLCLIQEITQNDDGGFTVRATECACPTYTLGVLIGAISAITGQTMLGKEIDAPQEGAEGRIYHINPF